MSSEEVEFSGKFAVKKIFELLRTVPKFVPLKTSSCPTKADSGETEEITGIVVFVSGGTSTGIPASFAKNPGFDCPAFVETITSPS